MGKWTIRELNRLDRDGFAAQLGGIFERSPWVAEEAWRLRPFASLEELHKAMMESAADAEEGLRLALLRAHPDLGARIAMTDESKREQAGAGLDRLERRERRYMLRLNRIYKEKFGFPFILAVKGMAKEDILAAMRRRYRNSRETEMAAAMGEVGRIARFRLEDMLSEGANPSSSSNTNTNVNANVNGNGNVSGAITTHVLDLALGRPASGMAVELWYNGFASMPERLAEVRLNDDGRADAPLAKGRLKPGVYELRFDVGGYYAGRGGFVFLELVPVRFVLAEPDAHYHVPLLVSPGGYSTYRGS